MGAQVLDSENVIRIGMAVIKDSDNDSMHAAVKRASVALGISTGAVAYCVARLASDVVTS